VATFIKKDGSPLPAVELRIVRPKPTHEGIVGVVENFEISHDHGTRLHRCRMSLLITDLSLAESGGFSPSIFTGAKVEVRLVR
jgi:hypothetical protein